MMAKFTYNKLLVEQIVYETADARTYKLRTIDEDPLSWLPGQFLTLVFLKWGKEERRSYSISSTPALQEPLSITVKRVPNGEYSRRIIETLQEGDELITTGVAGFFTLPPQLERFQEFVFICAGSGITPVLPIIKTLLHLHPGIRILLIYSNRSMDETLFYHQIMQLQTAHPKTFRVEMLFSTSAELANARLSNYWLETLLRRHHVSNNLATLFYMCGPFDYMLMVNITLLAYGVPASNIRKEHFSTFKAPAREEPPDREPHTVKLIQGDKVHILQTQYPVSILQKALKSGLELPFSCEAGRCGTCVAKCIEGTVWMSNNEVLLDEEIRKGMILTCTGYPVQGNVVIEI
ncbi:MAG: iron-sulfur cluster-binding domain-containing protein [Chitinophagaceae bacterium]|nr:iron-sulfur cluster-binding domain-containing protein [Chitinophagaceae bacterium]